MISYKDYIEYKVENELEYIKDLIGEGYFDGNPVENATEKELRELAEKVVYGLEDNDYLHEVMAECEEDEIYYQVKEMFLKREEE